MKRFLLIILMATFNFLFFKNCFSQNTEIFKGCKIISIDEFERLPNYYIISIESEKGKIILLSPFDILSSRENGICKNKTYDFEVEILDSIPIKHQDSTVYLKFDNFRGGNGSMKYYVDGEIIITFEDYNYKPYRSLNLKGLEYFEIKKKE